MIKRKDIEPEIMRVKEALALVLKMARANHRGEHFPSFSDYEHEKQEKALRIGEDFINGRFKGS